MNLEVKRWDHHLNNQLAESWDAFTGTKTNKIELSKVLKVNDELFGQIYNNMRDGAAE